MHKHDFLGALHQRLQPRTYFEIGVRSGRSLSLSRSRSVAVDPFYAIRDEILCDVHLVRTSSDEFFARRHPMAHFAGTPIDLAFIDGMHLAEYALRDFINTERHCHAASVVVIDDTLPRTVEQAGRGRVGKAERGAWAGDVFKMIPVLRRTRPDLVILEIDTAPTGTLVVMALDHTDRSLTRAYDAVLPEFVTDDPQVLPRWAAERTRAIAPERLLEADVWDQLVALREKAPGLAPSTVTDMLGAAGLSTAKEIP